MPDPTYTEKPPKAIAWVRDQIKTPPFSKAARVESGTLIRRLQNGESLGLPHSRPMPSIGKNCHELRVPDQNKSWRIVYQVRSEAILVVAIFEKTTRRTPRPIIDTCQERIKRYDDALKAAKKKEDTGNG